MYAFVQANCESCEELAPALRSIATSDDEFDLVIVALGGTDEDNRGFIHRNKLKQLPFAIAPQAIGAYGILGTPYLMLVDKQGRVRTKGIANHLEHLESLIDGAMTTSVPVLPVIDATAPRP